MIGNYNLGHEAFSYIENGKCKNVSKIKTNIKFQNIKTKILPQNKSTIKLRKFRK